VKKPILWLILLAAGVAGAWALLVTSTSLAGGLAQEATPSDDAVNAIARQLYCPVCENIPLDVCPTQACAQWRALIREKLAQGWTEEQIKAYFVEQYGVRVLNEPPRQGWNWLIYINSKIAYNKRSTVPTPDQLCRGSHSCPGFASPHSTAKTFSRVLGSWI
jgi:cytochrome c-type biogenesis protein CcmH/NrfF